MLERTAGCIESAGRRFLQGPGQHLGAISDYVHWQLAPRRALRREHSDTTSISATTDVRPPFLHFLYPAGTQEFIVTRLLRSSRGILSRRKRRNVPSGTRLYTSEATIRQPAETTSVGLLNRQKALAKNALVDLLNEGIEGQTDRAWELWVAADQPPDLNRTLLAQLSNSGNYEDHTRAKSVFQSISTGQRSSDDYLHLIESSLAVGKTEEVKQVCEDALKGNDLTHWAYILAHFVNNSEWVLAAQIWEARLSAKLDKERLRTVVESLLLPADKMFTPPKLTGPFLDTSSLFANFVDLARALEHSKKDPEALTGSSTSLHSLARFLVHSIFLSRAFIERIPSQTLYSLVKHFHSAALINIQHCYKIMRILLDAQTKPDVRRAVIFFQDCRWLMSEDAPPVKLLDGFFDRTINFRMTDSIEYFLDQYIQFWGKAGLKRYGRALVGLARTGDVTKVHRVFEGMVSHYGKPSDSGSLAPLLNVHACVGDVEKTLDEFEKISKDWGLVPGTICWNISLTAYAKRGDLKGCAERFTMMTKANVPPNSHTFGILLGLCGKRGDIKVITQLLASAKECQVQLTTAMLDPVVEAYCKMKDLEMAERVAEYCLNLNVSGSRTRMWNVILWSYATRLDLDSISRIRSRMASAGVPFDDMTYTALTLSLSLAGEIDSAHSLVKTLHQSRKMHLTETQYTILLLGYVKQNNRDMVIATFKELQSRFKGPQGSLSEEIQGLRRQIQRDLMTMHIEGTPDVPFKFTEEFLHEIIAKRGPIIVTKDENTFGPDEPQHPHRIAERKRMLGEAEEAEEHQHPLRAMMGYAKKGSLVEVERIWQDYIAKKGCPDSYDHAPFRMLVTFMIAYTNVNAHEKVDQLWKMAYRRALKMALPLDSTRMAGQPSSADVISPRISSNAGNKYKSVLVSGDMQDEDDGQLPKYTSPILPAYRFVLTRHLSAYMWSLANRGEIPKIKQLIADVEEAGFSLTTFNWSAYVQVLALSEKHPNTVEAFKIFEERFMPNFPGSWDNILQSKGFKHSGVSDDIHLLDDSVPSDILRKTTKKYWLKENPDYMQPTFVSLFQLSNAILRTRERSISTGMDEIQELYKVAPRTIDQLGKLPFLRHQWRAWRALLSNRGKHSGPKHVVTKQRIGRTKKRIFGSKGKGSDLGRPSNQTDTTEPRDFDS
ncbi:hypothetical protein BJX63DRAFT_376900 [Aspergillus granulosus]|uniref:Uncharacterized protein n=1 Tax=Aspergillus granulosus TaxID=176169 RepID=A0ABR4I483_9EURO